MARLSNSSGGGKTNTLNSDLWFEDLEAFMTILATQLYQWNITVSRNEIKIKGFEKVKKSQTLASNARHDWIVLLCSVWLKCSFERHNVYTVSVCVNILVKRINNRNLPFICFAWKRCIIIYIFPFFNSNLNMWSNRFMQSLLDYLN